jgi:tight adherence protein B
LSLLLLRMIGFALASVGVAASIYLLFRRPDGPIRLALERYLAHLDANLRFIRSSTRAVHILLMQALASAIVLGLCIWISPVLILLEVPVIAGPLLHGRQQAKTRIYRIDQQLDGWLLVLANALRAVPSIGDGLASSQALTHPPIAEELDIVLKEYQLGTPLDQALQNMGERLDSRVVWTALTILQVARRTGGDLSTTLETSAASLREMARLEGVVRTKTADGRNQAWVIGAMPLLLVVLLYLMDPTMLSPLATTNLGNLLAALAFLLWAGAIFAAIRILQVDI